MMMIISILSFLFVFLYVLLLLIYQYGWWLQRGFLTNAKTVPQTSISVVIAARNEAANIEHCIQCIVQQQYPQHLWELLIIDDFSTDNTVQIISNSLSENVKLISLSHFVNEEDAIISFKKKALAVGISQSKGNLIVTTDADCTMGEDWLSTISHFFEQTNAEMIVAPVRFTHNFSLLQLFQSLDFMTMQGITAAVVRLRLGIMCNGANLAFSRKAYDAVGGYEGVDHLVSGDDYLLQLKIKNKFPQGVKYLKSSKVIVDTLPQDTWSGFLQQRIRWASKTGKYEDKKVTTMLLLVYCFNFFILLIAILGLFDHRFLDTLWPVLLSKVLIELFFLWPVAKFFGATKQLLLFPLMQPLHVLYIIVAGFFSRVGKFEWKSRTSIQK